MANQTAKGKIIEKYLQDYPQMPSLTMAKIIFKENPLEWKDAETIRSLIRQYRGVQGERSRKDNIAGGKYYKNNKELNFAPYAMPQPESEDFKPYTLPLADNNIGVLSDFHIPNHREEPIKIAVKYLQEQKINTLILLGDVLDNTPFTRHDGKRPSASDVRSWFDKAELLFEWLRDCFPNATIYFACGNHDYWYKRWMQAHAWQLDEDPYFTLEERLHLDEYKIKWIPREQYILAGKLAMFHGDQLSGKFGSGVMPARTMYNKTKKSCLIGHVHKSDSYTEPNLAGEVYTCWTIGCLCTLTPVYSAFGGKANHGFAHVRVEKDGDFTVNNIRIINGKLV